MLERECQWQRHPLIVLSDCSAKSIKDDGLVMVREIDGHYFNGCLQRSVKSNICNFDSEAELYSCSALLDEFMPYKLFEYDAVAHNGYHGFPGIGF